MELGEMTVINLSTASEVKAASNCTGQLCWRFFKSLALWALQGFGGCILQPLKKCLTSALLEGDAAPAHSQRVTLEETKWPSCYRQPCQPSS